MLIAFALAYTTCISLSFAMNRHFQQVWPSQMLSARIATLFRNGGWLLMILTLAYCAKLTGIAVGLVLALGLGLGLFSAAACVLALLLYYTPKLVLPLAATISVLSFV